MKKLFYVLFLVSCAHTDAAKKQEIIASSHCADNSIDCSIVGDCISAKRIENNNLYLTIHTNNGGTDIDAYRQTFTYQHDTLSMNQENKAVPVVTNELNPETGKMEKRCCITIPSKSMSCGGPDIQRFDYTLSGFSKLPKVIQFNHVTLKDCPTKAFKFEIYKKDTINLIDAHGHKQGDWMEFYPSGVIKCKRYYNKGQFMYGYIFNEAGKATDKILQMEPMEMSESIR